VEKMKGKDRYRYRMGEWRIVYEIRDDVLVVLVLRIGPRGGVYKKR
jgi:mRNA interferase RelE/StbE